MLAISVSAPAWSQTADGTSQAADAVSDSTGDIVVTARRVAERLQDIPVAVSAVNSSMIANMSIREARDLSSIAPGLNIKTSSNNGQAALLSLRGQVPAGVLLTTDSSVGVYVDGYNNPRTNGFKAALVDIDRIEILRGPQGTLYGRNTTGGAISVITKSPVDRWEGSAQLRLGNYSAANFVGVINAPIAEGFAIRLVGQRGVHDGYGKGSDGKDLAAENSTYLRGKARLESGRLTAELYGEYQSNFTGGPITRLANLTRYTTPIGSGAARETALELGLPDNAAGYAAALTALEPYVFDAKNNPRRSGSNKTYDRFWGHSAGLDLQYEVSDTINLRSLTGYRALTRRNRADYDGTPFDVLDTLYRINDKFYSQEFQILGNFGRLKFVAGAYGSYEDGYEASSSGSLRAVAQAAGRGVFPTAGGYVTSKSIAGFVQLDYKLTDQLSVTAGGRYTKDIKKTRIVSHNNQSYVTLPLPLGNTTGCLVPAAIRPDAANCRGSLSKSFSDPSWLASINYKVDQNILVYAKVARGYRAGGQNLRGTSVDALAPFDPEYITEYEVGLKSDLFDRLLHLNIAAFHDNYSGVQRTVAVFVNNTSFSLVTNAAKSKIDGIEVESVLRPMEGLTLGANFAYINARYKSFVDATGDRSNEDWPTPKWTYSVTGRYEFPVGNDKASVQLDYQGQSTQNLYPAVQRQPADTTQKGYGLVNGRMSYTLRDMGVDIAVYGKNLTNKVYADGALSLEAGLGVNLINISDPRTFGIEITKTF